MRNSFQRSAAAASHFQRIERPAAARAFTLIEIMIVVGIISLVMVVGIPAIYQAVHPDSMRKAVADVMEACSQARAQAIIRGTPTELRVDPIEGTIAVGVAPARKSFEAETSARQAGSVVAAGPGFFHTRLSRRMSIEMLDVNFQEFKDAEEPARVHFYPNGTSDEFTIVLKSDQGEWRKISLEVTTALADIEIIR